MKGILSIGLTMKIKTSRLLQGMQMMHQQSQGLLERITKEWIMKLWQSQGHLARVLQEIQGLFTQLTAVMRIVHRHHVYITQHLKDPTSVCQIPTQWLIGSHVLYMMAL